MAVIMFGHQARQQDNKQDNKSEVTYEEFIERAMGMLVLRGGHVASENGIRVDAKAFRSGLLNDENLVLTPCVRYRDEGEAFVSPLTRGRHTGWLFGNDAFISVNTLVGLLTPGFQLPEYRVTRTCPRPTGQVGDDEMWIIGPWADRANLRLYATDTDGNVEPLEHWIERKIKALQPTD